MNESILLAEYGIEIGKTYYEVEANRKDVIFDENGNFVKEEM